MASRQEKIRIELFSPPETAEATDNAFRVPDEAVLRLARLIGRQMAREQFKRTRSKERHGKRT